MGVTRALVLARSGALAAALVVAPVAILVSAPPASAADITTCPGNLNGTTFTLTANCATTAPLTVPDGYTIDGAGPGAPAGGYTISATDAGGSQWNGGIVTNENPGGSMNLRNLVVTGPANGFQLCTNSNFLLYGIWFNDASGTVDNVKVDHIFQFQNGAFGSCQTGRAIRAEGTATGPARSVTITNTIATDYQKTAFHGIGSSMTMEVTESTAGPPHPLEGLMSQNGVTFQDVASGRAANNTIHGSGNQADGPGGNGNGTGVLLFNADNVTLTENEIVGERTDIGISVSSGSTGNTISFNNVTRQSPDVDGDPTGIGISVDSAGNPPSSATLICNTFSGWKPNKNIVGAIQVACTPLPDGAECEPYSAGAPIVVGGVDGDNAPPLTWEVETGSLPPGLTLAADGEITGTPTATGTYELTLRVTDADGLTATSDQTITIAPGCQAAPSTPHVRTVTSHDRVSPGQPFYDRIHVRGLAGGQGTTAVARLYGPFTSRAAATCGPRYRVRTKTLHVDNGWNRTPEVHINAPGVYTWRVTLRANAANRSATHRCGQAVETTTVAKLAYVAPIVNGGFSGTIYSPELARRAPVTIRMPAIGLRAPVIPERVIDGKMTLPANVGDVGWLRKSAGIGDKIGTAVIAGHVSDRHDNPGAMFQLSRAKAGQQITVTRGGTPYHFKVVSKATFDRRHRLPHRYFVTTGRHRLVLISCTDRVVFPNGHFHYTRYIVVVANQIHPHR